MKTNKKQIAQVLSAQGLTDFKRDKIIVSMDRINFNAKVDNFLFLHRYFKVKSPLHHYDFKNLLKDILSFKPVRWCHLYCDKDLIKNSNQKYKYKYLVQYKDRQGRKIHFKFKFPGCPITAIGIEFYPTIKHGFDYNEILTIFKEFGLDYRWFHPSKFEYPFDFYGDRYKKIGNKIWTESQVVNFGYEDSNGKKRYGSDPGEIPSGNGFTVYLGGKKTLRVKCYVKEELGEQCNRIEVDVGRYQFKRLSINNLDELFCNYEKIVDYIFNSFSFRKVVRTAFTQEFPGTDRLFNDLKDLPERYKIRVLFEKFSDGSKSPIKFANEHTVKVYEREIKICEKLLREFHKQTFFKGISESRQEEMRQDHERNKEQRLEEWNIKEAFQDKVNMISKEAEATLKIEPLDSIQQVILAKLSLKGLVDNYLGGLHWPLRRLQIARNRVKKILQGRENEKKNPDTLFTSSDGVSISEDDLEKIETANDNAEIFKETTNWFHDFGNFMKSLRRKGGF